MIRLATLLTGLVVGTQSVAQGLTPLPDDEVLIRLADAGTAAAQIGETRRLHQALRAEPGRVDLATELAWHYVRLARATGNARFMGYAQGALELWWTDPAPPPEILLPRATIKQNRHEFTPALADLDRLLELEPRNSQAWLTKSVIHLIRGDFRAARLGCVILIRDRLPIPGGICLAELLARTGRAQDALALLTGLSRAAERTTPDLRLWALTASAEISGRIGLDSEAENRFQQALALIGGRVDEPPPGCPPDMGPCQRRGVLSQDGAYLLSAYAEFLLERGRNEAVLSLLQNQTAVTPLLLRLAIAERRLGNPEYRRHGDAVQRRLESDRSLGRPDHPGETARLLLHVLDRADLALPRARDHWQKERSPSSANLLLEAALATGNMTAAEPVLHWVRTTRIEDIRLQALARAVAGD